jgi:hypothetical protein
MYFIDIIIHLVDDFDDLSKIPHSQNENKQTT